MPSAHEAVKDASRRFALITAQRIRRATFDSVQALEDAIAAYLANHNQHCKPFIWTATADAILDKVARFCQRTSETRH
jgi:hypothetical protein